MRIEIRNDSVILDGYVNAVERDSRPIYSPRGKFIERIEQRAFERALGRAENVDLLLNHNKERKLGSIKEGNLELIEDSIGLRAICTVTDKEIIEKAKNKQLRGWSFGFYSLKDSWGEVEGIQRRTVKELDLFEVSIIDNTKLPAYVATSIEARAEEDVLVENRAFDFTAKYVDETKEIETKEKVKEEQREVIDYSKYEKEIEKLKIRP